MRKILLFLLILLCVVIFKVVKSSPVSPPNDKTTKVIGKDKPIENEELTIEIIEDTRSIQLLDSLIHLHYFTHNSFSTDTGLLNICNLPKDSIPYYSDSVYYQRIQELNIETPFKLVYNPKVRRLIDYYISKRSNQMSKVIGLSQLYFPLFEEQLDKFGLPLELKYLAVIESSLNPKAISSAGAGGMWQFMYNTGKIYDLNVNSYVDERFDPYKSTVAACKHLKYLHKLFGDWTLAIAAYNVGQGNLMKAIRKSGGSRDFWTICKYLPRETRYYVPTFIAAMYVMNYASEHNIYPQKPCHMHYEIDTVTVQQKIEFTQAAELLSIPIEDLKILNPTYKHGLIPSTTKKKYILTLPKEYIGIFINNEEALYNYRTIKQRRMEEYAEMHNIKIINGEVQNQHIVRRGETLGGIAVRYNCSTSKIRSWNNLKGSLIRTNQKLYVYEPLNMTNLSKAARNIKDNNVSSETSMN